MYSTLIEKRLAETVAWCSLQTIENNFAETEEFRRRKALRSAGLDLLRRATLLEKRGTIRSWLLDHLCFSANGSPEEIKREAQALLREGDLTSVYPLNDILRTKSLTPAQVDSPTTHRAAIVEDLANRRAQLLRDRDSYPLSVAFDLAGGKLLRYEPEDNFSDGASQDITLGYFDVNDAPPWDTWIVFAERSVLSWVPCSFVSLVAQGISVNPVDCIGWADEKALARLAEVHG